MRSCAKPLNTSGKRGRNNLRNKVVRRARATPAQEQQLRAAIKWTASSPSFATACVQVVSRKHTSSAGVQERFPGGIVQKSSGICLLSQRASSWLALNSSHRLDRLGIITTTEPRKLLAQRPTFGQLIERVHSNPHEGHG